MEMEGIQQNEFEEDVLEETNDDCLYGANGDSQSGMNELREFHILDELPNDSDTQMSDSDSDMSSDEVERMLEEAYSKHGSAGLDENGERPFNEKDKIVLLEKSQNHFEILPEGWIQVTHDSGMPLYLHKASRVCTFSKPYFLGSGSARKHEVPISAFPCLAYCKALEEELNESEATCSKNLPNIRVETAKENAQAHNLTPAQVQEYCAKLFRFKNVKVMKFKSWSQRRRFHKDKKHKKLLQRPTLPDGTKLITFQIQNNDDEASSSNSKREWIMNPNGKSYICILHEYVQHALKKQPIYKFTELENAATPYAATISINDMEYGMGYGTSKKEAKSEAARATLEILIPEMRSKITSDSKTISNASKDPDLLFFDDIKIEDPRVTEFCNKTAEPLPHDILLTCLQRNFGLGDLQINYQGNNLKHQKSEFTMTVGKHTATVVCKNKRDGKQQASQVILQALHPHIQTWGSLLRLYGNCSVKTFKEKKLVEKEITLLQSEATVNSPNFAILNKLKLELSKLKEQRDAVKPVGLFIPPRSEELLTLSSSNLENIDL